MRKTGFIVVFSFLLSQALMAVTTDHFVTLSLEEVVAKAIKHQIALKIADNKVELSRQRQIAEEAEFDFSQSLSWRFEKNRFQQNAKDLTSILTSIVAPNARDALYVEENWRLRHGFKDKTLIGLEWELGLTINRLDNTVNRNNRFFHNEYESFWGLTLKQTLLKGRGFEANAAKIMMAQKEQLIAVKEKEATVIELTSKLAESYHQIFFKQEEIRAKEHHLMTLEHLLKENEEKLKVGQVSAIDLAETRAEVAKLWEEMYRLIDQQRIKKIELLKHMGTDISLSPRAMDFKVVLPRLSDLNHNLDEVYEMALHIRPDFALLLERIAKAKWKLKHIRNQSRASLDFAVSFGLGGLENNLVTSLKDIVEDGEVRWGAGLRFMAKLGKRNKKSRRQQVEIEIDQLRLKLIDSKQDLKWRIHDAYRHHHLLELKADKSKSSVIYSQKNLDLIGEKVKTGKATHREFLEAKRKHIDAQTRALSNRIQLNQSLVDIFGLGGDLMERLGFLNWRKRDLPKIYDHHYIPRKTPPQILREEEKIKKEKLEVPAPKEKLPNLKIPKAKIKPPKKVIDKFGERRKRELDIEIIQQREDMEDDDL